MKQKNEPSRYFALVSSKSRWLRFLSIVFALLLGTNGCQTDIEVPTLHTLPNLSKGKINLSYEVETVVTPELEGIEENDAQRQVMAMAFSTRNKIQVNIREDGSSTWRMERMKPKANLEVDHLSPAGSEPQTQLTVIDETGMASFFDEKGALLYTNSIPAPSFKSMMDDFKENPNAIFSVFGVQSTEKVNSQIEKARANGAIVQDLGNGMVSVRSGNSTNSAARSEGVMDNMIKVDLFNKNIGLCLGSTLYDQQNQIICETFYSYVVNTEQRWIPNRVYFKGWDQDPISGKRRFQESTTIFENVVLTIK